MKDLYYKIFAPKKEKEKKGAYFNLGNKSTIYRKDLHYKRFALQNKSAYFDLRKKSSTYKKGLKNPYKKKLTGDILPLKYKPVMNNYRFPDQKKYDFYAYLEYIELLKLSKIYIKV